MAPQPQLSRSLLFRFIKRKSSFLLLLFFFTALIIYNMTGIGSSNSSSLSSHSNSQSGKFGNLVVDEEEEEELYLNSRVKPMAVKDIPDSELPPNVLNSKLIKQFIFQLSKLSPDDQILQDNQIEFANSDPPDRIITVSYLNSLASVPKKWIEEVKDKHTKVLTLIKNTLSNLSLISSKDGAVIIGGVENNLTWLALISTRLFRRAGGVLPVEVMLPTIEDYYKDQEICDIYLPQLNAKCVVIKDLLESSKLEAENILINTFIMDNFHLIKRELAILLSSFENVLFLTPENVMLKPMESTIFEKLLYKEYGLFIWEDFSSRLTLPSFYDIVGINVDTNTKTSYYGFPYTEELIKEFNAGEHKITQDDLENRINYHDFANTLPFKQSDSSELIINKKTHLDTLFLSLYYNLNGPKAYHLLLMGNFNGEHGSKETILAAAHVLNNKYYLMNTNVESNGFWYDDQYHGVSMLQFDPIVDFYSFEAYITKFSNSKNKKLSMSSSRYQKWLKESSERRSPLFLNINNPSLKPVELIRDKVVIKDNGDRIKLISVNNYIDAAFESDIWRIMNDYICHLSLDCDYVQSKFSRKLERDQFCKNDMTEHLSWITSFADDH